MGLYSDILKEALDDSEREIYKKNRKRKDKNELDFGHDYNDRYYDENEKLSQDYRSVKNAKEWAKAWSDVDKEKSKDYLRQKDNVLNKHRNRLNKNK